MKAKSIKNIAPLVLDIIKSNEEQLTWEKILKNIHLHGITISSRTLRSDPNIVRAYRTQKEKIRRKKEIAAEKHCQKNILNGEFSAEGAAKLAQKLSALEERIDTIFANAVALGIDLEKLERPLNVYDFGNTFRPGEDS